MAITINTENQETLYVTDNGIKKTIPRSYNNYIYHNLIGDSYQDIKRNGTQYIAFPFVQKIGNYIFVMFSEGDAHASSDRQKIARKAVSDIASQSVDWTIATFYENSSGVYDLSLFDIAMSDGEEFTFKSWLVSKSAGAVSAQVVSTVTVSGYSDSDIDGTYALWSQPRQYGSKWYRTGYATYSGGSEWNTALFESTDQITWTIKGVIAKGIGNSLQYNECDIAETTSGNYIAVIREETGTGRPLYTCTSSDLITWTTPVLSSEIEGVQPNLNKLASNTILLCVGDRTDRSGYNNGGIIPNSIDSTGIAAYTMESPYSSFSKQTFLDKTWSTDGGQPWAIEYSTGDIFVAYYNASEPTNLFSEPGVRGKVIAESNLV